MKRSKDEIEKRQVGMLDYIKQNKTARVEELGAQFQVSEVTVRRDLEELEDKGKVRRFFGGAELADSIESDEPKFDEKRLSNHEEKIKIAEYAASLVKEGTSIFMNSGTTVVEVLKRIKDKGATVITSNALASEILCDGNCELLCTGGVYNRDTKGYMGEYSTKLVKQTYAKMTILGVNGIDSVSGITTSLFQDTFLLKTMLDRCTGKKIVVTDGSKIGRTKVYKSADITQIDMLITTSKADPEELERIRNCGVEVVLADQV